MNIQEIRKSPEGLAFELTFDLNEELTMRNPEILSVTDILAVGKARYEDGFYVLEYQLSYKITLTSSRSMEPVERKESYFVDEAFTDGISNEVSELLDQALILPIENEEIDLAESVADNILLHIPLKILTKEEEEAIDLPSGDNWRVMTEEVYQERKKADKLENSPFASLQDLFEEE